MMSPDRIQELYLEWLKETIRDPESLKYKSHVSFERLLNKLHSTQFVWHIRRDENRAEDGISLRYRYLRDIFEFSEVEQYLSYLSGPCSVLEMMVALSLRCEETIMDNPDYGNRTSYWFWSMINNLGLGAMYDERYNDDKIHQSLSNFLNRNYSSNGAGGLFTIRGTRKDLRKVEIWYQMCWYLDKLV